MKKIMSQKAPKHMLDNKILLKLEKIFISIEINTNSTYPLSESSMDNRQNKMLLLDTLLAIHLKCL